MSQAVNVAQFTTSDVAQPLRPGENASNTSKDAPQSIVKAEPSQATPPPKVDPQEQRLQQLARQEKAIRRQAQELKMQKAAFEAVRAEMAPKAAPQAPAFDKQAFLRDPTAFGIDPNELSQATLNHLSQSPETVRIRQLEAKLAELEGATKKINETFETTQTQAYEKALKQVSYEVNDLVASDPASYEAISFEKAQDAVTALIDLTWKEEGRLLKPEVAAKQVEDHLRQRATSYSKLSFLAQKTEATATAQSSSPKQTHPTPTLTNSMTQASTNPRMTAKDRIERAKLAFNGQLK